MVLRTKVNKILDAHALDVGALGHGDIFRFMKLYIDGVRPRLSVKTPSSGWGRYRRGHEVAWRKVILESHKEKLIAALLGG